MAHNSPLPGSPSQGNYPLRKFLYPKPDDIKKILGVPSYEGIIEHDQIWAIEYFLGEYSVIFYSKNKDSPIISGILKIADSTE